MTFVKTGPCMQVESSRREMEQQIQKMRWQASLVGDVFNDVGGSVCN